MPVLIVRSRAAGVGNGPQSIRGKTTSFQVKLALILFLLFVPLSFYLMFFSSGQDLSISDQSAASLAFVTFYLILSLRQFVLEKQDWKQWKKADKEG